MRLLSYCGALAAGEFVASLASGFAGAWPVVAVVAVLTVLFGYGFGCRGWRLASVFLLGACLFLHASVEKEQAYREKPWARGREWMLRPSAGDSGPAVRIRRELGRRIGIGLEGDRESAALGRAILLGERTRMPRRMRRMFVESGTIHAFAVSGLHIMAIADVLTVLMMFSLIPRRLSGLVAIPVLWGYVGLIGFPPSAVRAAAMATFSGLAPVFWRKPNGLRSWALAFLVIHLLDPLRVVNVGNALSFAVMLAIVAGGECVRGLARWKQALLVTTVAWAAGVPIAAHVFGCVTPGGLLANLVLISAAKLTVVAGAVGVGVSFVSEAVAAHVNNLSALGIRLMVVVAEGVSSLPCSTVATGNWPISACAVWYAALACIGWAFWRFTRRRRVI